MRDIPAQLSLDPRARVEHQTSQLRELMSRGVSVSDDTINALLYALEASEVDTVLTAGQIRTARQLGAPAPPKERSLWDYLEDS